MSLFSQMAKFVRRPIFVVYRPLPDLPAMAYERSLQSLVRSQLALFSRRRRGLLVNEPGRRGRPIIGLIGPHDQWTALFQQWASELDFTLVHGQTLSGLFETLGKSRNAISPHRVRCFFPKPEPPADLNAPLLLRAGSLAIRLRTLLDEGLATAVAWMRRSNDLSSILPSRTVPLSLDSTGERSVVFLNTLSSGGGAAGIARTLCDEVGTKTGWSSRFLAGRAKEWSDLTRANLLPLLHTPTSPFRMKVQQSLGAMGLGLPTIAVNRSIGDNPGRTILHLHNLHGEWISEQFLADLPESLPVVWTLHDMQAFTGHCAHSLDCTRWKSGCGSCPHLDTYPALVRDTTAWHWLRRQGLASRRKFHFVLPSQWLAGHLAESLWRDHPRSVIYNGVDTAVFQPQPKVHAKEKLGLDPRKKVVLFAADLGLDNPWKGGRFLLDAVRRLQILRKDIEYVAIGSHRAGRSSEDGLFHVPYITDRRQLATYYSAADLLAYPSLADNCPLVVLEALACGTPVVSFRTGGIPELIKHGVNGWLCQYKDANDFLRGLEAVLATEWPADLASQEAVKSIKANFSQTIMVDKYMELYESLLS